MDVQDGGTYVCRASNAAGVTEQGVEVIVEGQWRFIRQGQDLRNHSSFQML